MNMPMIMRTTGIASLFDRSQEILCDYFQCIELLLYHC